MKPYNLNGFDIHEYEELLSTNTQAREALGKMTKDRTVILTYKQTGGRGQADNKWESEEGKNLSLSVIFKPQDLDASKQFAVSMVISLACLDFIRQYVEGVTIKWPNDIYVKDEKVGGILIEHNISGSQISSSICGIGLNINQEKFYSDAPNPVSLYQLTGKKLPLDQVLAELLAYIDKRYKHIHLYDGLVCDYLNSMYRRNGIYLWKDHSGPFEASIHGIDEYGRLILRRSKETLTAYGFKEVECLL